MRIVALDLQAPSSVEDRGFQKFLKVINQKCLRPSRQTIMWDLLPKLCNDQRELLKSCLDKSAYCAVTTDLWTSQGFITLTCHYISEEVQVHEKKGADSRNCSDDYIYFPCSWEHCKWIDLKTSKWDITYNAVCTVTDNGSNIQCSVSYMNNNMETITLFRSNFKFNCPMLYRC